MSEIDDVMAVVRQSAFNIQTVGEQMGIISTELKNLKIEQLRTGEKIEAITDRMQNYEDRLRVNRACAQTIRRAIHARASELLGIEYENGRVADRCINTDARYRGKFISRCYYDAREHSKLGTPYYETYQRDYREVLDYIGTWVPQEGVTGYKEYLDKRARERALKAI